MRAFWLTDIHLNFLSPQETDVFLEDLAAARPDAVLLGGDIGEARNVIGQLARIDDVLAVPIYFVLGNHDFYHGSIAGVRRAVDELCRLRPRLHYLTTGGVTSGGVVRLAPGVGLIGHDGWADVRVGDYERSLVMMNDYRLIAELANCSKQERLPKLRALGDEAAEHIRQVLPAALAENEHVLLLTHVPPLLAACWYDGRTSDEEWSPHFTCLAVGEACLEIMAGHPERKLTVLCGHTHSPGTCQPLPNMTVLTGGAEYGQPAVQRVFEY
ncbi:MAG: metallophosphoesterase [Planctomycetia bacterium]|nr:metallophosphoesterase [Planctomycetia bacterium]